jgi:hypothetical protein
VDSGTKKVYLYTAAASRTSGSQSAAATFALAPGDTNPQGIADPPPADMLLTSTAAPLALSQPPAAALSAVYSVGPSTITAFPSLVGRDAVFALPVRELVLTFGTSAIDVLAVGAITPRLDSLTPVADGAWTLTGTSAGKKPMDSMPLLTPASSQTVRSDRDAVSVRDGSGADEGGLASTADLVFALPLIDTAEEE